MTSDRLNPTFSFVYGGEYHTFVKLESYEACVKSHNDNVTLMKELQKLIGEAADKLDAIDKITRIDCPNYMAHPQSVWWEIHWADPIKRILRGIK